jgi:hypothetical protein
MSILLQPAIAHLGEAEHPFDDPDRMFDPSPHFGLGTIFCPLDLVDNAAVSVAAIGEVLGLRGVQSDHRTLAAVGLIAPYSGLLAVQQIRQHRAVGGIGGRGDHRVDQLAAAVDAKMRLDAKIPLVALLGLMHLGIARLGGILGRRRRIDDRGIDDRTGRNLQPFGGEMALHLIKQPPAQIVRLGHCPASDRTARSTRTAPTTAQPDPSPSETPPAGLSCGNAKTPTVASDSCFILPSPELPLSWIYHIAVIGCRLLQRFLNPFSCVF